jgi:tRNA A37 threonylcarbamoyladenosine biosynthesis protein TsaE
MDYILGTSWDLQPDMYHLDIFRINSSPRILVLQLLKIIENPKVILCGL